MSNTGSFGGRKSWRRSEVTDASRRTTGRVVITLLALGLIALFAFMIWRGRPHRRTNVLLVSADTFNLEMMMPLMYGGNARQQIRQALDADLVNGQVDVIRRRFRENESVRHHLNDPDDTFVLFVRGYLLAGPDGQPGIACSDLAVGDDDAPERGLLPLNELLQPLATVGPEQGACQRVVVLDLEPLAADPRLGQHAEAVLESLQQTVRQLAEQPLGDRVWLLITRGPLENAGWDHRAGLPVSTQSFLQGITGKADFNGDHEIRLSELCDYVAARYRRLAGGYQTPPRLVLLQGGTGRVTNTAQASDVWVARSGDFTWDDPGDRAEEGDAAESETEQARTNAMRASPPIRNVRRSSPIEESGPDAGESDAGEESDAEGGSDQGSSQAADDQPEPNQPKPDPSNPETPDAEATDSPAAIANDFWDIRDRLESTAAANRLGPVGLSPHLWRLLVRQLLHAEIESLDGQSESRALRAQRAIAELRDLEQASSAHTQGRSEGAEGLREPGWRPSGSGVAEVDAIASAWDTWRNQRAAVVVDNQVRAADSLQQAIAIARSRVWNWLSYQQQAIVSGGSGLGDDAELRDWMERGESLLYEQQGSTADVDAVMELRDRIIDAVDRFDQAVAGEHQELLRSLRRRDPKRTWGVTRHADAWLRSSLPSGPQRRQLQQAIGALAKDDAGRGSTTEVSDRPVPAELSTLRREGSAVDAVDQWLGVHRATLAADRIGLLSVDPGSDSLRPDGPLWSAEVDPVKQMVASLRIDPRDTAVGLARSGAGRPIVHGVTSRPHVPQPSSTLTDEQGMPLDTIELTPGERSQTVVLRLRPDSDAPTSVTVSVQLDDPRLRARWREPVRQGHPIDEPLEVSIGPRQERELSLEVSADGDAGSDRAEGRVEFEIDTGEGVPLAGLTGTRQTRVKLPQRDEIRLVVSPRENIGFSEPIISGQGDLPDGVWLRTFASRTTPFRLSLFNDASRPVKARLWLIRLDDPYADQGVRAYWPGLQRKELPKLGRQMRDSEGRVSTRYLSSALRGPIEIALPGDNQPVPLRWVAADADAEDDASSSEPRPAGEDGDDGAETDVSHGMALVVRLLGDTGQPLSEEDQIVWMLPKPWNPETYLDLPLVRYRDGQIHIRAALKNRIDGDDTADRVPEIDQRPVLVRWWEDDQWVRFQVNARDGRRDRLLELDGVSSSTMELPVPDRERTFARLEVDGWPRALHREVEHRQGAEGRPYTQRNTVEFSSVAMAHEDSPPDDREAGDANSPAPVWFPKQVVFRGGGRLIETRLSADFSSRLLDRFDREDAVPELQVSVNDSGTRRYWTDRRVRTVATAVDDDGEIRLRTTVEDPVIAWTTEARREDTTLHFGAELLTDGAQRNSASLELTLDSTPPVVEPAKRESESGFEVGREVRWEYRGADVGPGGRPGSGIAEVQFQIDVDGDRVPDVKHPPEEISPPMPRVSAREQELTRSFVPEAAGLHHLVIQAWDAAGLASEPAVLPFVVQPKSESEASGDAMAEKPKTGVIRGRIATGSTLRGTISIKPAPPGIEPDSATFQAGGANPTFAFRNLPEQEYTITFRGTVNNVSRTLEWSELLIDAAEGGTPAVSLSLDQAEEK